jgi:hypothetical protein
MQALSLSLSLSLSHTQTHTLSHTAQPDYPNLASRLRHATPPVPLKLKLRLDVRQAGRPAATQFGYSDQ